MKTIEHISKHIRDVYLGGNWTAVCLIDALRDVTWEEANQKLHGCNDIATLVYHLNYYIVELNKVFRGEAFASKDELSFDSPPINSEEDWDNLTGELWTDVQAFAGFVEKLEEDKLWEDFIEAKYGNYYRNLQGIVEHVHYHLGQIMILKKVIRNER